MTPQDKASLSAQQRAEKIMQIDGIVFDTGAKNDSVEIHQLISTEIEEAIFDALKRYMVHEDLVAQKARAEALEEAAKVVDIEGSNYGAVMQFNLKKLADKLRALISKDKP